MYPIKNFKSMTGLFDIGKDKLFRCKVICVGKIEKSYSYYTTRFLIFTKPCCMDYKNIN